MVPILKNLCRLLLTGASVMVATVADGAVVQFNLDGKGGAGLTSTNENGTVNGGLFVGGEVGPGIYYDDVTNILTLHLSWATGAGPGFTGLSGNANFAHIHGPTPSSGAVAFLQDTGVAINLTGLPGWSPSGLGGGLFGVSVAMTEPQEVQLLAGRFYINVHTALNPGGEIRGQLVAVPEPSTALLGALGVFTLLRRRRTV